MELGAIIAPLVIGDQGKRRAFVGANVRKAGRKFRDLVAVAHPHLMFLTRPAQAVEQDALLEISMKARPNSPAVARFDLAAQLMLINLPAIADAEECRARCHNHLRRARACLPPGTPAGDPEQDHALGFPAGERLFRIVERSNLR